jgi:hypothetical protein
MVGSKWLYSLSGVNIRALNDEAFRLSCQNGHLSVAQWLFEVGGVDMILSKDYEAFRYACFGGHLPVAHWLYTVGEIPSDVLQECLFEAMHKRLKLWLQSILSL